MVAKTNTSYREGAAFAEALVVFPFFAAALIGIVALHNSYAAKLEAKARARRMAWLQAESGDCPAQTCRNGCKEAEVAIRSSGLDQALSAENGQLSSSSFLGDVGGFFIGRMTNGVGVAEAPWPNGLGKARTRQQGVSPLLCNTKARSTAEGVNVIDEACSSGLDSFEYAEEVCK